MKNDIIKFLLDCPKVVTVKPKRYVYQDQRSNYTMRNEFACVSLNGEHKFEVFMRFNTELSFVFSIGLVYHSKEGDITIARYNGKHNHKNKVADHDEFSDFHIHMLYDIQLTDDTADSIDAKETDKYITYDEALFAFLNDCNIQNWQTYFPDLENKINQLKIEGV